MDASAYALSQGIKATRTALAAWQEHPWRALRGWIGGSLLAGSLLLVAIWAISELAPGRDFVTINRPPFAVGDPGDVARIFGHNLLVLALHAMACVAGFIAGGSLPLQAQRHTGLMRVAHEQGRRLAIAAVVAATTFSLSLQAYSLGTTLARVAGGLHVSPGLLLLGVLPHALPELVALFLPLAAWIIASRRGEWDTLLAAGIVTVMLALPALLVTASWEVYIAPHLLSSLIGYR